MTMHMVLIIVVILVIVVNMMMAVVTTTGVVNMEIPNMSMKTSSDPARL